MGTIGGSTKSSLRPHSSTGGKSVKFNPKSTAPVFHTPTRSNCKFQPLHSGHSPSRKLSKAACDEIDERRRKTIPSENSDYMQRVALYDSSIQSKVLLNRSLEENRKLKHHVILLQ